MTVLKVIVAAFYAVGVFLRNILYDIGVLRSTPHEVPVICVGNITVGGTGKTPAVEFLVAHLEQNYHPAVLSRGYGRRTKGYLEVADEDSFVNTGDEPMQIKRKFPSVPVVVCEDRNYAVERIVREHPQIDVIIMDDGFQHRSIAPRLNVVLIDYTRPVDKDCFLPYGSLRDERRQLRRADIFLVTKSPESLSAQQKECFANRLNMRKGQKIYFSSISYGRIRPLFDEQMANTAGEDVGALLFSGIANPKPFIGGVSRQCRVLGNISFPDHYVYKVGDMRRLEKEMRKNGDEDVLAVTTEKDAVKLVGSDKIPSWLRGRLYVLPMQLEFSIGEDEQFIKNITYVIGRN